MPLYRYKCFTPDCDREYDDLYFPLRDFSEKIWDFCPVHGSGWFEICLSGRVVHDWSNGRYYEHVSASGETFYSKKEFKDYLKENGMSEVGSYG